MKKKYILILLAFLFTKALFAQPDYFVGEIRIFAGNYAPTGWLKCEGQLISISENPDLYSILGTTYGGDGIITFALPDLCERMAMGNANNLPVPDLSTNHLGLKGAGQTTVVLNTQNLPPHTHNVQIKMSSKPAVSSDATPGSYLAVPVFKNDIISTQIYGYAQTLPYIPPHPNTLIIEAAGNISPAALKTEQPYLVCNYIIAVTGVVPFPNN